MLIKILNFLKIVKGIYLKHNDGDVTESWLIKKYDPFTNEWILTCNVEPFLEIGRIFLNEDGTIKNACHYVKQWRYMDD